MTKEETIERLERMLTAEILREKEEEGRKTQRDAKRLILNSIAANIDALHSAIALLKESGK